MKKLGELTFVVFILSLIISYVFLYASYLEDVTNKNLCEVDNNVHTCYYMGYGPENPNE